jgi:hypothetical protein
VVVSRRDEATGGELVAAVRRLLPTEPDERAEDRALMDELVTEVRRMQQAFLARGLRPPEHIQVPAAALEHLRRLCEGEARVRITERDIGLSPQEIEFCGVVFVSEPRP